MKNDLCKQLGIEFPIFAFSHCRDVVAAVSRAGGLGVLGALAYSAEELETELAWIDAHVGGMPYGVDTVIPAAMHMGNNFEIFLRCMMLTFCLELRVGYENRTATPLVTRPNGSCGQERPVDSAKWSWDHDK